MVGRTGGRECKGPRSHTPHLSVGAGEDDSQKEARSKSHSYLIAHIPDLSVRACVRVRPCSNMCCMRKEPDRLCVTFAIEAIPLISDRVAPKQLKQIAHTQIEHVTDP